MLKAGIEGINHKTNPHEPFSDNIYHFNESDLERMEVETLPENLEEAVEAFLEDPVVSQALGGYISKNLVKLKKEEFEEYISFTGTDWRGSRSKITRWEVDRYLTRC
jgi:glutamine synthetase